MGGDSACQPFFGPNAEAEVISSGDLASSNAVHGAKRQKTTCKEPSPQFFRSRLLALPATKSPPTKGQLKRQQVIRTYRLSQNAMMSATELLARVCLSRRLGWETGFEPATFGATVSRLVLVLAKFAVFSRVLGVSNA